MIYLVTRACKIELFIKDDVSFDKDVIPYSVGSVFFFRGNPFNKVGNRLTGFIDVINSREGAVAFF
jgi:hypothetical protein